MEIMGIRYEKCKLRKNASIIPNINIDFITCGSVHDETDQEFKL